MRHRCGQLQQVLLSTQAQLREEKRKNHDLAAFTVKLKKKVTYYKRVTHEYKLKADDEVSSSGGGGSSRSRSPNHTEEIKSLRQAFEKSEDIRRQ